MSKKSKCQISLCLARGLREVTYRLWGLDRAGGEGVSTAAALRAEVRGGGGGVVDVGQDVMVSALLLRSVCVVTVGGRSACKWNICDKTEGKKRDIVHKTMYKSSNLLFMVSKISFEHFSLACTAQK